MPPQRGLTVGTQLGRHRTDSERKQAERIPEEARTLLLCRSVRLRVPSFIRINGRPDAVRFLRHRASRYLSAARGLSGALYIYIERVRGREREREREGEGERERGKQDVEILSPCHTILVRPLQNDCRSTWSNLMH